MSWWICRDGEGSTGDSVGKINWQHPNLMWKSTPKIKEKKSTNHAQNDQKSAPKFSLHEGGRVATGENTSPADSWPRDSSSSTFWEYEMLQRVWSQNMEYKDAGYVTVTVLCSLAFYQLTVLSPTLHNTIQLGNYLAGGAWRDDYSPCSQLVSVCLALL